jgi:hypothetical protein
MCDNYKNICKKGEVILKKHKKEDYYKINLNIKNNNYDITRILTLELYDLLFQLNKELIEDMKILEEEKNNKKIMIYFKQFGKGVGIKNKYMLIDTHLQEENNMKKIIANNVECDLDIKKGYEMMKNDYFELNMNIEDKHNVPFECIFNISIDDDLPIYMKDFTGILIKKLFLNLKVFIEKIE